ncbi:MAG: DnaA/Hda family protein, partial [Elusimicrobiaceae bacterium]
MIEYWEIRHLPSPEDDSRYCIFMDGDRIDVDMILMKLGNICGRPRRTNRPYTYALYLYNTSDDLLIKAETAIADIVSRSRRRKRNAPEVEQVKFASMQNPAAGFEGPAETVIFNPEIEAELELPKMRPVPQEKETFPLADGEPVLSETIAVGNNQAVITDVPVPESRETEEAGETSGAASERGSGEFEFPEVFLRKEEEPEETNLPVVPPPPTKEQTERSAAVPPPSAPVVAAASEKPSAPPASPASAQNNLPKLPGLDETGLMSGVSSRSAANMMKRARWTMEIPINPACTAETLIPSVNRFAHAAVLSVISNPGGTYNPLLLHGPAGTGKTHYLMAIAYGLSTKKGFEKIFVTNGLKLSRGVYQMSKQGSLDSFEQNFLTMDALLIDDIHLMALSDENTPYISRWLAQFRSDRKQIVVTSAVAAQELRELENRLNFEFDSGTSAIQLKEPSADQRKKIVVSSMEKTEMILSEE